MLMNIHSRPITLQSTMSSHDGHDEAGPSNGEPSKKRQRTGDETNGHSTSRLAFLGPVGTYGHQAAMRFSVSLFEHSPELLPCPTIAEVWDADAEYLVLPLENTIGGGVRETLFCMVTDPAIRRELQLDEEVWSEGEGESPPSFGADRDPARIVADLDLRVDHSLIVKRGTSMSDIKWVKSHEQALVQCSAYLSRNLTDAKRIPCSSTAAATASLLEDGPETGPGAAIASTASIRDSPDLTVMSESIQAVKNNTTRFLLFTRNESPFIVPSALRKTIPLCPITEWFVLEDETKFGDLLQDTGGVIKTILGVPQPQTLPVKHKYPKSMVIELDVDASLLIREHDALRRIGMREYHVNGSASRTGRRG